MTKREREREQRLAENDAAAMTADVDRLTKMISAGIGAITIQLTDPEVEVKVDMTLFDDGLRDLLTLLRSRYADKPDPEGARRRATARWRAANPAKVREINRAAQRRARAKRKAQS